MFSNYYFPICACPKFLISIDFVLFVDVYDLLNVHKIFIAVCQPFTVFENRQAHESRLNLREAPLLLWLSMYVRGMVLLLAMNKAHVGIVVILQTMRNDHYKEECQLYDESKLRQRTAPKHVKFFFLLILNILTVVLSILLDNHVTSTHPARVAVPNENLDNGNHK